jgi:AcrR family transcriptional regulator
MDERQIIAQHSKAGDISGRMKFGGYSMARSDHEAEGQRDLGADAAVVEAGRPRRPTRSRRKAGEAAGADNNVDILDCAAQCFMEMGFQGTSIDDVARRLGATKGRIYHYYASKTDLFFDVHREGMRRLNEAVNAVMDNDGNGRETLRAMLEAHALTMLVVVQGVHMHRLGATTLAQRQVLDEIMAIRRDFEKLFADVFRRGREDGSIRAENTSIAIKGMLGAVNWTAVWYRPRANETLADKQKIARELATLQVEGVA